MKRIGLTLAFVAAIAVGAYFYLRVHSTQAYFGNEVVVTYDHPVVGNDSITFDFNKPGTYVVAFVPSDTSDTAQMPVPFVVNVGSSPLRKVVEQKGLPKRLSVTIISTNSGFGLHDFP